MIAMYSCTPKYGLIKQNLDLISQDDNNTHRPYVAVHIQKGVVFFQHVLLSQNT